MAEKLQGIFTPNMVPLAESGRINEPELRRYIDWLVDHGVHGLHPDGSLGEFIRFTPEERRRPGPRPGQPGVGEFLNGTEVMCGPCRPDGAECRLLGKRATRAAGTATL